MLNQFKSAKKGALGEYIIENYKGTGYRIVTIATEFPDTEEPDWGRGVGSWTVDYPDTSATFWSLMKKYKPIAVMTTSRNKATKKWVLEIGAKNLPQDEWYVGFTWNMGRPPHIGGAMGDPAKAPGLPNAGLEPKEDGGNPPDATRDQDTQESDTGRDVTADVSDIQDLIIAKLNGEEDGFDPDDLFAEKDIDYQGIGNDSYVSAFTGYHAVWYDHWSKSCKAGWHTHVDSGITTPNASKAIKLQLEVLIKWLNEN